MNTDSTHYKDLGYCVFHDVLNHQEMASIQENLDRMIASMPEKQEVYDGNKLVKMKSRPEYLAEPHSKDNYWLELCRHPKVLDAVESVLGPDLVLILSHLIVKRPIDGLPVGWHQDNTYWPSVHGTDVATVWLAIDDVDLENACMKVVPRSQEGYEELEMAKTEDDKDLLALNAVVTDEMVSQTIPIEMSSGSMSIHDSFILHGSEANQSSRRRAVYTMRYANPNTTRIDTEKHWVDVYVVRGDAGKDGSKYVDLRPGKPFPQTSE